MARLPCVPAFHRREEQDLGIVGAAQARNRKLECSGCGRKFQEAYDARERAVRDLPWSAFTTTVHVEVYRVKCLFCGLKIEKVPLLPSKAPFSQRFEDAVGQACESAAARQVARRFGLAESTVRAIDLRFLERGTPPGAARRSGKWEWMRSTWAKNKSF
jgi:transposase